MTYEIRLSKTDKRNTFGDYWYQWEILQGSQVIKSGKQASQRLAQSNAERVIGLIENPPDYDNDYGLTNEQGMGFSAESKKEWEQRIAETPLTRYVEDEFGEIVKETEIIVKQGNK